MREARLLDLLVAEDRGVLRAAFRVRVALPVHSRSLSSPPLFLPRLRLRRRRLLSSSSIEARISGSSGGDEASVRLGTRTIVGTESSIHCSALGPHTENGVPTPLPSKPPRLILLLIRRITSHGVVIQKLLFILRKVVTRAEEVNNRMIAPLVD